MSWALESERGQWFFLLFIHAKPGQTRGFSKISCLINKIFSLVTRVTFRICIAPPHLFSLKTLNVEGGLWWRIVSLTYEQKNFIRGWNKFVCMLIVGKCHVCIVHSEQICAKALIYARFNLYENMQLLGCYSQMWRCKMRDLSTNRTLNERMPIKANKDPLLPFQRTAWISKSFYSSSVEAQNFSLLLTCRSSHML